MWHESRAIAARNGARDARSRLPARRMGRSRRRLVLVVYLVPLLAIVGGQALVIADGGFSVGGERQARLIQELPVRSGRFNDQSRTLPASFHGGAARVAAGSAVGGKAFGFLEILAVGGCLRRVLERRVLVLDVHDQPRDGSTAQVRFGGVELPVAGEVGFGGNRKRERAQHGHRNSQGLEVSFHGVEYAR